MEEHHNVRILDEAIVECVKLSNRYITGRQLPDKMRFRPRYGLRQGRDRPGCNTGLDRGRNAVEFRI